MKKPIVVLDFDGTLADTAPIIRKIYEQMSEDNNWSKLDDKAYSKLRLGTLSQARRWAGIKWWQMPRIIKAGRELFRLETEQVEIFPGMKQVVEKLQSQNVPVYILSRNTPELIEIVLKRNKIKGVKVLNRVSILGKQHALRKIVRAENATPGDVWMVGDEVRDIKSAHKAKVSSIAVSWGLQDESLLKNYKPTYLIKRPEQILSIVAKGNK